MCGLVGCAGLINDKIKKVFKDLLILDGIRGPHSTGVMSVNRFDYEAHVNKVVGDAFEILDRKSFEKDMFATKCVLMGHNRWATRGSINKTNAHPFEFETLIGAHNGTLHKQALLDDSDLFDVDSENIYHHMEKNGVEDTIKKLDGSFALTWWNKKEKTINFIRNKERPLYFAYSKDRKTLLWASEAWMLEVAADRNLMDITNPVACTPLVHYEVSIPHSTVYGDAPAFDLDDMHLTKMEEYVAPKYPTQTHGNTTTTHSSTSNGVTTYPSNVCLSPKKKSGLGAKDLAMQLSPYLSNDVEFEIVGSMLDDTNTMYIEGQLIDDKDVYVRMYPEYKSDLWDELMGSGEIWKGVPKKFSVLDNGYLLLDLRTLVELTGLYDEMKAAELAEDGEDDYKLYPVAKGRFVREDEFRDRTSCGCCWCSSGVDPEDAEKIKWVDDYAFLCEGCKDDPDVLPYIGAL